MRPFTDIAGIHLLDLNNELRTRERFAKRLKSCGLAVDMSVAYWQKAGDLTISEAAGRGRAVRF